MKLPRRLRLIALGIIVGYGLAAATFGFALAHVI